MATDFDLHGFALVRLLDADQKNVSTVARQLGFPPTSVDRKPDIVIRFHDDLAEPRSIVYVGPGEAGFTDDAFYILKGRHKAPVHVRLDLERRSGFFEVTCERNVSAIPFLIALLNVAVLEKDILALHAAAFVHDGVGTVVTGWSKGGKTEALLAFAARGARYVGDEWVYVTSDGQRAYGIPEPVRVWDWHLDHLPQFRDRLPGRDRARLRAVRLLDDSLVQRARVARRYHRARPLVVRQLGADVAPALLFEQEETLTSCNVDQLFLAASHSAPDIQVERISGDEVATRMLHSLQYERAELSQLYHKYLFAFPQRRVAILESVEETQGALLRTAFSDKEAFLIRHPYPVDLNLLFEAMAGCGR